MICNHNETILVLTPNSVHHGKLICKNCGTFMGFKKKPENENIRTKTSKYTTEDIIKYYGYEKTFCFFCGRTQLGLSETFEREHIKELKDGGSDQLNNLQILCTACHKLKLWTRTYLNKHQEASDNKWKITKMEVTLE